MNADAFKSHEMTTSMRERVLSAPTITTRPSRSVTAGSIGPYPQAAGTVRVRAGAPNEPPPTEGVADVDRCVNAVTLPSKDAMNDDSRQFLAAIVRSPVQRRLAVLFERGLPTDGPMEVALGAALHDLADPCPT